MDLMRLLYINQPLLSQEGSEDATRAHTQFARDYSVRIRMVRNQLGAADAVCGFRT